MEPGYNSMDVRNMLWDVSKIDVVRSHLFINSMMGNFIWCLCFKSIIVFIMMEPRTIFIGQISKFWGQAITQGTVLPLTNLLCDLCKLAFKSPVFWVRGKMVSFK